LIEAAMLVALGFLSASLLALAALPALSRRADRLARRRAEAAFPLSLAEIAADRDHLRAELAVRERALEQKAESGFAAKAGAMSEIGRRDMTIGRLETDLSERKQRIEALESELGQRTQDLAQAREMLASESAGHQTTQATLSSRVSDLAALEAQLAETRQSLSGTSADLAARSHELAELRALHEKAGTMLAERDQALSALTSEHDLQRVALVEAGTLRLKLEAGRDDLSARLAAAETALAEVRTNLAAMKLDRDSERLQADALTTRANEAEAALRTADANAIKLGAEIARQEAAMNQASAEHAETLAGIKALEGKIEAAAAAEARLKEQMAGEAVAHRAALRERDEMAEALHAEIGTIQGARDQARADRAGLKRELAALRKQNGGKAAGEAALRQEIVRLADALLVASESREAAE
jgi:chromosome segregation ATPase